MARDKLQSLAVYDLKLKLISDRQSYERLYNLPNTTKVVILIVGDEHIDNKRDIIIEKQIGVLKKNKWTTSCIFAFAISPFVPKRRRWL